MSHSKKTEHSGKRPKITLSGEAKAALVEAPCAVDEENVPEDRINTPPFLRFGIGYEAALQADEAYVNSLSMCAERMYQPFREDIDDIAKTFRGGYY